MALFILKGKKRNERNGSRPSSVQILKGDFCTFPGKKAHLVCLLTLFLMWGCAKGPEEPLDLIVPDGSIIKWPLLTLGGILLTVDDDVAP